MPRACPLPPEASPPGGTPVPPFPTAETIRTEARRLGFAACGFTTLEPLPHAAELDRWLKAGYAGNMRYIHRQAKKRKHPQLADLTAKTAIVVLDNYYHESDTAKVPVQSSKRPPQGVEPRPRIARYARGEDYHRVTLRRLEELAAFLRLRGAGTARPYVDTGPVAERELAQRAGLGWIGKNTMLIHPRLGSWFFIGTVLTDLELSPDPAFATDHCGSCTRCLEACPTSAFVSERVLDATRCISYVTIEQKGTVDHSIAQHLEGWAFGCDVCNEVCPWNERFATPSSVPEFRPRPFLEQLGPEGFATMDPDEFDRRLGDTPLARPGLVRMRRNWEAAWASLA